jgi:hypothetical protein
VLEAAFVLLEFSSPSRRIFIGSHSLPPSLVRRIGPSVSPRISLRETWMDVLCVFGIDLVPSNVGKPLRFKDFRSEL